jgi:nitrogen fixation protein NifB
MNNLRGQVLTTPDIDENGRISLGPPLPALRFHPCYSHTAHSRYGRIHLPVAPACNIQCNYCDRKIGDCYHALRPGVTSRVMKPQEVVAWIEESLGAEPRLKVAGIAGPGEPLANEATFRAIELVGECYPHLLLCLSTNGLLLPQFATRLASLGVTTVTVTMNALHPSVGARIYAWVTIPASTKINGNSRPQGSNERLHGQEGAALLIRHQLEGIARASAAGMAVKVNTVLIPGVNDAEIAPLAEATHKRGAMIQNVTPLIPMGEFRHLRAPRRDELEVARDAGSAFLPQFLSCRQCRADAVGVPGEDTRERVVCRGALSGR